MDLIKMTRDLGAAIQADERYSRIKAARENNDKDTKLNEQIAKIQLVQMSYQQEASKPDANQQKLEAYDKEFRDVYGEVMLNKNMQEYEEARKDIDDLMNYIMQLLALCVNGENPETCEPPKHEEGCAGSCSSCSGGC